MIKFYQNLKHALWSYKGAFREPEIWSLVQFHESKIFYDSVKMSVAELIIGWCLTNRLLRCCRDTFPIPCPSLHHKHILQLLLEGMCDEMRQHCCARNNHPPRYWGHFQFNHVIIESIPEINSWGNLDWSSCYSRILSSRSTTIRWQGC